MAISVVFVMRFASAAPGTRGLRPCGWQKLWQSRFRPVRERWSWEALRCSECTDKLCSQYCRKLR